MTPERIAGGTPSYRSGFTLGELLLAVLCLGVLMLPLLAYVSGIQGIGWRIAEESGGRAWQSMQSAAVAEGVDASGAGLLARELNPGVSSRARSRVAVEPGKVAAGRVTVASLHIQGSGGRLGASGFQLGPGNRLPEPEVPAQTLIPVTMRPPEVSPAPGSLVPILALHPSGSLAIQVRSGSGVRVLFRPDVSQIAQAGLGELSVGVTAPALALGLHGQAWAEYAGDLVPGAVRVPLADGRAEWRVPEAGGVRLYSPSDLVPVTYFLGLGAPVLRLGASEYSSGAVVPVDYPLVQAIQAGRTGLRVGWPEAVRSLLGTDGLTCISGFVTSFQGVAGSADGNLAVFAVDSGLASWDQDNLVTALPLLEAACRGDAGTWVLSRALLQLPPPEMVKVQSGPLSAGLLGFRAAEFGDLGRIGRLSARAGAMLASGPSLDLEVTP